MERKNHSNDFLKTIFLAFYLCFCTSFDAHSQLNEVWFDEKADSSISLQLEFQNFPDRTDYLKVGLISFDYQKGFRFFRVSGQDYLFSDEDEYRFEKPKKELSIPAISIEKCQLIHISYFDSTQKLIIEEYFKTDMLPVFSYREWRNSPQKNVLRFHFSACHFDPEMKDSLDQVVGKNPYGIWQWDLADRTPTYYRGKTEVGTIQPFQGYRLLNPEKRKIHYRLKAYDQRFLQDKFIFDIQDSLALELGSMTVKKKEHTLLKDSIEAAFKLMELKETEMYASYQGQKVSKFLISKPKDSMMNGVLMRIYQLDIENNFPDQKAKLGVTNNRYGAFRPIIHTDGEDKRIFKTLLKLDSGSIQPFAIAPARHIADSDSLRFSCFYEMGWECCPPIEIKVTPVESVSTYELLVQVKSYYKRKKASKIFFGECDHTGKFQGRKREEFDPYYLEQVKDYRGSKDKIFEGEKITIIIPTKDGTIQWYGTPDFSKKDRITLKLETSKGRKIKVKMYKY